jgi:hypothetical protein
MRVAASFGLVCWNTMPTSRAVVLAALALIRLLARRISDRTVLDVGRGSMAGRYSAGSCAAISSLRFAYSMAGQYLPPSHSQVHRSLSMLRVKDISLHSGQSFLHGLKIEAGAREVAGFRILLL